MELHLHNPTPTPLAAPPMPSYIPPFGIGTVVGALGVLLAVHVAGFNEHITEIGLADISGQMHLGHGLYAVVLCDVLDLSLYPVHHGGAGAFGPRASTGSARR